MKTNKYLLPVLLSAVFLVSLSCKKEYEFPDITQEGKGTFGCKIDGRIYVPKAESIFTPQSNLWAHLVTEFNGLDSMIISVRRDRTESLGHLVFWYKGAPEGLQSGTYRMQNPLLEAGGYSAQYYYRGIAYLTDINLPGQMEILRFDRNERIISAKFEFTLIDQTTGELVEITEGRFDLKLN